MVQRKQQIPGETWLTLLTDFHLLSCRNFGLRYLKAHLVANLLIYHNVVTMTKALERLATDGYTFDEDLVSYISPYLTEHINRFGRYLLKRDRVPEPLEGVRVLRMPPRSEGIERIARAVV